VQWKSGFWIGMTERSNNWTFVEDGAPVTWFNWYPGEPNDYQGMLEECALLYYRGNFSWTWTDVSCSHENHVICELDNEL